MKISLSSILKTPLLALLMLVLGGWALGQTTLVNYQFTGNLNADAGAIGSPSLTYHANGGAVKTPSFDNNMLSTSDGNDYLQLSINTTGKTGLILSFNADFAASFIFGYWTVSMDSNNSGTFVNIPNGQLQLWSIFGIRTSGNLSVPLPTIAENNPNLKLRITASSGALFDLWNLRLDNLKLTSGSPNIRVYTGNNTDVNTDTSVGADVYIPHLSAASRAFDTDFGTRQVTDAALTRTFRVRNFQGESGSKLKVTSISVQGANPGDFTVSPASLDDIDPTASGTDANSARMKAFNISFLPLGDGVRTAEIYIYSNAAPSPYIFTVIGTGASCQLVSTPYVQNTMAAGQQTLAADYNPSTDLIGGVANPSSGNTLNTRLYPDGNLYTSSPTSWYVRSTTKTVEFGGLDISNQKNVAISFKVAAFSTANNRGVNSSDYVTLAVQKPDNSWSNEMRLQGSNASDTYWRYGFNGSGTFTSTYAGSNPNITQSNSSGTKYSTVVLNIPASANISNLKFRITANTNGNNRLWLIDDVKVLTSNAVYKTFTTANVWSPSAPTANEKAIIEGNYTNSGNVSVCECEVKNGGSLTIPTNTSVTVRGKITNLGDGSNFVVASDGNLIQVEDGAVNTGNITALRTMTWSNNRKQYNFLASPVAGQNMKELFGAAGNTPYATVLNEKTNYYVNASSADYLVKGKGFAVKEPFSTFTGTSATYKGAPNNGIIKTPIQRSAANRGWNLVGNPYPSNIDLNALYADNSTKIESTFRFWDNTTNSIYEQQGGNYGGASYAIYNAAAGSSGTGIPAPGQGSHAEGSSKTPNGIVKPTQGFLIRAVEAGSYPTSDTLVFRNSIRLSDQTGTVYYGRQAGSTDDRYQLESETPSGLVITQAVVYFDKGSNSFGIDDSQIPNSSASDLFYSFAGETKAIINGRSTFNAEDVVSLGTRHYAAGNYTIRAVDLQGVFASGQAIYLKDRDLNTLTDLTQGGYTFYSDTGDYTNRFEIVYRPESTLATDTAAKDALKVYRSGSDFVIRSEGTNITGVEAYDMSGRLVKKVGASAREVVLPDHVFSNGVYILKIWQGTQISTKKIIK